MVSLAEPWVMPEWCIVCGDMLCEELDYLHCEAAHARRLRDFRIGGARHWEKTQQGIELGLFGPATTEELAR